MIRIYFKLTFIVILISFTSHGQSILSNGDAETYWLEPSAVGQFDWCTGWDNCSGDASPDYWHIDGTGSAQLPNGSGLMDSMMPYQGGGVLAMVLYNVPTVNNNFLTFREYLDKELDVPMTIGETYDISLRYHSKRSSLEGCQCFSIHFTTYVMDQVITEVLVVDPHYTIMDTVVPLEWTYWSGTFIADSAYSRINLGNFFSNIDTPLFDSNTEGAISPNLYYTIDDLKVGLQQLEPEPNKPVISSSAVNFPNIFTPNGDGINDVLDYMLPSEFDNIQFTVVNRWGNMVYTANSKEILWDGYTNGEKVEDGTYFWLLTFVNTVGTSEQLSDFIELRSD